MARRSGTNLCARLVFSTLSVAKQFTNLLALSMELRAPLGLHTLTPLDPLGLEANRLFCAQRESRLNRAPPA
jgi:hypothetical protein